MRKLIVVTDWADDSLTCQEVRSAVGGFVKNAEGLAISFVASTPSTIHTAYLMRQIVATESHYGKPGETVIFQNTDPRIQTTEAVEQAKGAEFIIVRMNNGMYLCGPNAGYNFSLIRELVDQVFIYPGLDKGSQFRSRDLYARMAAYLMDYLEDDLDLEEISTSQIPELTGFYVGHIDNYGNIKTTMTVEDMKGKHERGEMVRITINEVEKEAKYVSNLFGGTPGELVIYPGSSGAADNPYLEISVWRHFTEKDSSTGKVAFNNTKPGQSITML